MKKISNFFKTVNQKIGDFLFKNRYGTVMVFVGVIVAFWDFTTKFLFDGQQVSALNGVFSIFSTHNTGGAWSIFSNATWLLIVFSILFIAAIIVLNYFLKTKTYFYAISLGLLLSGAICNLYDRIAYGFVRDFIKLDFINFPIFNIADICICVGVVLLAVYFIFIVPKIEKQQKLATELETQEQAKMLEKEELTQDQDAEVENAQENTEIITENTQNQEIKQGDTNSNDTAIKKSTKTKKSTSNSKAGQTKNTTKSNSTKSTQTKSTSKSSQKKSTTKSTAKKSSTSKSTKKVKSNDNAEQV